MGDRLTFSFGHIIAFVSLMFIGYVTFMSAIYFTGADFGIALICVLLEMLVFGGMLMLIQKMKTVQNKFKRNIWIERLLLLVFVVMSYVAYWGFAKFWSVQAQEELVSSRFVAATEVADTLFNRYDEYCNIRQTCYSKNMQSMYLGIPDRGLIVEINDTALAIKLRPESYYVLRKEANKWILRSSQGVSVWNVFMLGNARKLRSALLAWHASLQKLAGGTLKDETYTLNFDEEAACYKIINTRIDQLEEVFHAEDLSPISFIAIPLFLLLLLPYFIQIRYYRSTYTLLGRDKSWKERKERQTYLSKDEGKMDVEHNTYILGKKNLGTSNRIVLNGGINSGLNQSEHIVVTSGIKMESEAFQHSVIRGAIKEEDYEAQHVIIKGDIDFTADTIMRKRRRRGQTFDFNNGENRVQHVVTTMKK